MICLIFFPVSIVSTWGEADLKRFWKSPPRFGDHLNLGPFSGCIFCDSGMSKKTREKSLVKSKQPVRQDRRKMTDMLQKPSIFHPTRRFERPIFLEGFVARKLPQRTCQLLFHHKNIAGTLGRGGNSTIAFLKIRRKSKWAPKQAAIFSSLFFSVSMARWIWAAGIPWNTDGVFLQIPAPFF